MAQIGSILREARIRMGLSLKQVSEITKVRASTWRPWRRTTTGPSPARPSSRPICGRMPRCCDSMQTPWSRSTAPPTSVASLRRDEYYDLTLEQMRSRTMRGRKKRPVRNTRRGYTLVGVLAIVAVVLLAYFGSRSGQRRSRDGCRQLGRYYHHDDLWCGVQLPRPSALVPPPPPPQTRSIRGASCFCASWPPDDCFVIIQDTDANGNNLFRGIPEERRRGHRAGGKALLREHR